MRSRERPGGEKGARRKAGNGLSRANGNGFCRSMGDGVWSFVTKDRRMIVRSEVGAAGAKSGGTAGELLLSQQVLGQEFFYVSFCSASIVSEGGIKRKTHFAPADLSPGQDCEKSPLTRLHSAAERAIIYQVKA